uniref:peripherin-2 n=1 Tax=Myxine glutinosa TaxID=7769 RepID=UPI00358E5113
MAVLRVRFTKQGRDKLSQALWVLNSVSVVGGIIIFCLGIILKIELKKRGDLMDPRTAGHSAPNLLIFVGLLACALNILGGKICYDCAEADKFVRWKVYLLPYIIGTFFFTFIIFVGAVVCYAMRDTLEEAIQKGLRSSLKFYKHTDMPGRCFLKETIDWLQIDFHCCGSNGFRDWFEIQWISQRYLDPNSKEVQDRIRSNIDGKYLIDAVPFSCCNPNFPRPCIHEQMTNNSAHYHYDYLTEKLNLWQQGCADALLHHYLSVLHSAGLIVCLIWLFELSVLLGARFLQTAMSNVVLDGDPDGEGEAWLLEGGILETAKNNLNIIKSFRRPNQISTVSETEEYAHEEPVPAEHELNNIPEG